MGVERIVLTGGAGFVGLNITEHMLSVGVDVISFDRRPIPKLAVEAFSRLPGHLDTIEADIRDIEALEAACRHADAVVHASAITPNDANEAALAETALAVNVGGTVNAVRAAGQTRLRRMVFLSSAAVYGANANRHPWLDEERTDPAPRSVYAISKFAAERLAQRLSVHEAISMRSLRIGSVFGPWEYSTGLRATLSAIFQVTEHALSGEGPCVLPRPGKRDWIYSRDVAAAVRLAIETPADLSGPINVGLGEEWSVADWCDRLTSSVSNFTYRFAATGEPATVDFHGSNDRSPLSVERLHREIGFRADYGLTRAFDDYLAWITDHRQIWGAV